MEKAVTLRFYDLTRSAEDRPPFADLLRLVAAKPMGDRERHVGLDQFLVRLENFAETNGEVHGQFIRGQSGNRPGQMLAAGTGNLPFAEPLGHGIAFRYRTADGLLAVQFDAKILSPVRIVEYLAAHDARAEFTLTPRMRADAWARFNELPLRKLEVSIAGHANPADLEADGAAVWSNIARMKHAYGADTIRFEISMGHRDGSLLDTAKALAREAFARFERGDDDIRALRGVVDTGDGVPNDEIDLMGTLFDVKESLAFNGDDFPEFYRLRKNLLKSKLRLL